MMLFRCAQCQRQYLFEASCPCCAIGISAAQPRIRDIECLYHVKHILFLKREQPLLKLIASIEVESSVSVRQ